MNNITYKEYWEEVEGIAANLVCEALQSCEGDKVDAEALIQDSLLHESIDGHEWVIYTAYHLDIIQISPNDEYLVCNFGNDYAGELLAESGLNHLHMAIAFWALYADVQDKLDSAFDAYENSNG